MSISDKTHISMKTDKQDRLGDEAPQLKHYIIVLAATVLLIAFARISWYKFGWFH